MATGRPQRASPSRMRRTTSACSACVPCEKFSRATPMPAAASRSRSATLDEAGPMVQTILVRRIVLLGLLGCPIDKGRNGFAGEPRALGGVGGHFGAPHQTSGQELAGVGTIGLARERLRRADGHDPAALVAALGTEIDHP